jgi:hypothetical protein
MKMLPWKRCVLTTGDDFGRTEPSLIWERKTQEEAAPREEPKSVLCDRGEAAAEELLKPKEDEAEASGDRFELNWRSAFGREEMFGRLEMSPERFLRLTDGFEAMIVISEEKNFEAEVL